MLRYELQNGVALAAFASSARSTLSWLQPLLFSATRPAFTMIGLAKKPSIAAKILYALILTIFSRIVSKTKVNQREDFRETKFCKTASKNPGLLYNSSLHRHPFRAATAQTHQWLISNRTLCAFANKKAEGPYFHIPTASLDQSSQRIWHRRGWDLHHHEATEGFEVNFGRKPVPNVEE